FVLGAHRGLAEEEERALVGVGTEEGRNAGEVAAVGERAWLVREESAVDHRAEAAAAGCIGEQRAHRDPPETRERLPRARAGARRAKRAARRGALSCGGGGGGAAAALADPPAEELPAARRHHVEAHVEGTRRLAEDGHQLRVAAEGGDVGPHPLEGGPLV